ncbi:hypothetical protein BCR41DRAFT_351359 [Lobosporangium transversale]|uniref:SAP domain-containing protein n=1 Tax=Lobosporangium transversale TaxID=64571 RepID=A0A1Y2GRL1_9FUNG|nr:hypothetical protein BCR41DRAFT_351359 [Lobosporangium transversale]ORZ20147.1 hypothetical protein BCR41DRAFT_351359 [Lobosporangium transversale]|eukprot:XP_021882687.1 hypothetical protein BCR41DRAFT_351359 [Lobosporangium transversale]
MAIPLSKRRKAELIELATKLGLATDGRREDIADRIRDHITKHGSSDPSLHELTHEGNPKANSRRSTESNRLASLSSANDLSDDTSEGTQTYSRRSSPRKIATTKHDSDSESLEDLLPEYQARDFMGSLHSEVQAAVEKAYSLEHALHDKFQSGKAQFRRASKDLTSTISHAVDGVVDAVNSSVGRGFNSNERDRGKARRNSRYYDDDAKDGGSHRRYGRRRHRVNLEDKSKSYFVRIFERVKHHFEEYPGIHGFSICMSRGVQRVHDVGSTSTGFVFITFLFEFAVYLSAAFSHQWHKDEDDQPSFFGTLMNWPDFLLPFFCYYSSLFVLPTLLSQLFNVDVARKTDAELDASQYAMTGLLSRSTTSGLSYFAFKFALTYCLSQYGLHHHHVHHQYPAVNVTSRLTNLAKDAAETVAMYAGMGEQQNHYLFHWMAVPQYAAEVFRFVPASLSLATSGVGTILALAEIVVKRHI